MIDMMREMQSSGCFAPAYPSLLHHAAHTAQLQAMAAAAAARCARRASDDGRSSTTANDATSASHTTCDTYDAERRLQMHALLGLVLREMGSVTGALGTFSQRCEAMLRSAASMSGQTPSSTAWARRTHIFQKVMDLAS